MAKSELSEDAKSLIKIGNFLKRWGKFGPKQYDRLSNEEISVLNIAAKSVVAVLNAVK